MSSFYFPDMRQFKLCAPILVIFVTLAGFSCQRKWKKTAPVEFKPVLSLQNSSPDLDLQSGILRIDKFEFEGKRQQGNDVFFSNEVDGLTALDITTSSFLNALRYDIPQGTYDEIRCRIRVKSPESSLPSVHIEGNYVNASSQSFPVIFEAYDQVPIEISLTGYEVVFIEETDATGRIQFGVNEWFSALTANQLDSADLTMVNSVQTILIDEQNNIDLYEIIFSRIGTTESIYFN